MTRAAGRTPFAEMLALLLVEFGITFFLAHLILERGRYPVASPDVAPALVAALAGGLISLVLGAYRPRFLMRTGTLVATTVLAGVLAFPAVWGIATLFGLGHVTMPTPGATWPAQVLLGWLVSLLATRLAFRAGLRNRMAPHRVAWLGAVGEAPAIDAAIRACQARRFELVVMPGGDLCPDRLCAAGVRTVVFPAAAPDAARPACPVAHGAEVLSQPEFWERHLGRVDVPHLDPAWFERLAEGPHGRSRDAATRVGDVLTSLVLLVFVLPVMAVVAALIWLDDPGPVLYRQEREGLGGRRFVLLKFRSMRDGAEARGPVWAQQCDPRVTRVGAFLRRTRIDELPQLLNVLRGEMSFIGPRPERPHFVEQLAAVIPFYRERARVKPGLTGWAQVNFPYGASVEDARSKLSYDLYYIKNRGPMLDLWILLATVRVILFQEGAR